MKGFIYLYAVSILAFGLIVSADVKGEERWSDQFDTAKAKTASDDSILSLNDVLKLVAEGNQAFRSFDFQLKAAQSNLKQAELRANPELSAEIEEFGWNSPGFKDSEFSISLSQEFEFFGQRGARKNVANAGIDDASMQIKLAIFDLYLETKLRFYSLAYTQQALTLSQASLDLTKEIVENITSRLNRGAALQSELLLAQLEQQRAELALAQAIQDVVAIEANLVSLWDINLTGLQISFHTEPNFSDLQVQVRALSDQIEESREISQMFNDTKLLLAEKRLTEAEAKPPVTLSGGFKRFESDNSKSFLFGVSMPIPFFNRNQGTRENINAKIRSLEFEIEQSKKETKAAIHSQSIRLNQLIDTHASLDSLLLPTAKKVYRTLQSAYEAGRVPYTQLLEAERTLNELSFEYNDMLLAIQEQIIALEHLTGVTLRTDKEN